MLSLIFRQLNITFTSVCVVLIIIIIFIYIAPSKTYIYKVLHHNNKTVMQNIHTYIDSSALSVHIA